MDAYIISTVYITLSITQIAYASPTRKGHWGDTVLCVMEKKYIKNAVTAIKTNATVVSNTPSNVIDIASS